MRQPATGLRLPTVPPPEQENIHNVWDTVGQVEGEIAMKGFTPMDTPSFECPVITPEMLTTADNNAYSTMYAEQNSWFTYASQVQAQISTMLLQIENEMEMIESRTRVRFREDIKNGIRAKMGKDEMQDEINIDSRYSALKLELQIYKQKKVQLTSFVEGIERGLRLISRQVEIRRIESDQTRTNIPGRGYDRNSPWRGRSAGEGEEG